MSTKKITLNELRSIVKQMMKEEIMLNEDILILKQLSKQLYSLLKSKGFNVELTNALRLNKVKNKQTYAGDASAIEIIVDDKTNIVMVAIPTDAIVSVIMGNEKGWWDLGQQQLGKTDTWFNSPKVRDYVQKLGTELTSIIKKQYPNMKFDFPDQGNWFFVMRFALGTTAKGGVVNPNQRPNAQQPAQQQQPVSEGLKLRNYLKESDILNANFRGVDSNNKLIHVDVDLLYEESEDEIRFTIQQNQFNNQMGAIGIVRIKKQGRNLLKLQDVLREVLKNKFPFLAFNFKTITAFEDYGG